MSSLSSADQTCSSQPLSNDGFPRWVLFRTAYYEEREGKSRIEEKTAGRVAEG